MMTQTQFTKLMTYFYASFDSGSAALFSGKSHEDGLALADLGNGNI